MTKLKKAKEIIKEYIKDARYGLFYTRNFVGDHMETIYRDDELGLTVDICWGWGYFEVFGLTDQEFGELVEYYEELKGGV